MASAAASAFQSGISRNLRFVGAILALLTLVGGGLAIWDLYEREIKEVEGEMRDLGLVLAAQASGSVEVIDLLLREMQSRGQEAGIRSRDEFRQNLGGEDVLRLLGERLKNLPQVHAVGLFDADGVLVNTSRGTPVARFSFAERDNFRHLRDHADAGMFVSAPGGDRAKGPMAIFFARRINGPDGLFLGLVVASVDVDYLLEFYRTINQARGVSVTLLRRDGLMLARYPTIAINGQAVPADSPWHARVAAGGGTFRTSGFFSGIRSIVSANPLRDHPLVIDVSVHDEDVLANWRRQAVYTIAATTFLAGAFAALFWMIARQMRRQEAHEDRLRDFAELASDWFWEQDKELRFTDIGLGSPLAAAGGGSSIGKRRWEINDVSRDPERWEEHRREVVSHRRFVDFRFDRIGPDGRNHHVSVSGVPVHDRSGAFAGYRGTGRDITADVEAAEELRMAKEQAEAMSRAKSEFLANMGHELRTPLHAIIGFSELIHDPKIGRSAANHVAWAGDILASGRRLLDIINDVLELSKIDAGHYPLADDTIDLSIVARNCFRMVKPRAGEKQVRLEQALPDTGAMLHADSQAVKKIVLHLVTNAVKFTPGGGVVSIRIEQAANGDLVLAVADTGIGIDPAVLTSLFEPFTQADASIARKYGGTGLGLAISRKLVDLHGGALTIESALGLGTTVRVTFPAARVVARSHQAAALASGTG